MCVVMLLCLCVMIFALNTSSQLLFFSVCLSVMRVAVLMA